MRKILAWFIKKTVKNPVGEQGKLNPISFYFMDRHNELVKKVSKKQ